VCIGRDSVVVCLPDSQSVLGAHKTCYHFRVGNLVPVSARANGTVPRIKPVYGITFGAVYMCIASASLVTTVPLSSSLLLSSSNTGDS